MTHAVNKMSPPAEEERPHRTMHTHIICLEILDLLERKLRSRRIPVPGVLRTNQSTSVLTPIRSSVVRNVTVDEDHRSVIHRRNNPSNLSSPSRECQSLQVQSRCVNHEKRHCSISVHRGRLAALSHDLERRTVHQLHRVANDDRASPVHLEVNARTPQQVLTQLRSFNGSGHHD